ncbi:MAG: DUF2254 domain-containing protein [Bacteroidota bacterium]
MKARLLKRWDDLRSSYWFIPTLMSLAAIGLSFVTTAIDGHLGPDWIQRLDWLYGNRPDGARSLLSTVAGSMLGVAGVTFSVTIASVVYASGQYGPRLLTNFMQDTGNQVTLGTFIATFLYCLLVLRTVRSAGEATGDGPAGEIVGAFVPHVAVLTGLGLALASTAILIYFIHHTPESIHVSNVIAGIGQQLERRVETLFPERIGHGPAQGDASGDASESLPEDFFDEAVAVEAPATGYVQSLDTDAILTIACKHDLIFRLTYRPGDFVSRDEPLLLAWPADRVGAEVREQVQRSFAWGPHRTALQDVRFLIDELVEIAARALSPGVNDPFTAVSCMDWLGSALKRVAQRDIPSPERRDAEGTLRVLAEPTTFAEFCGLCFDQLRPYAAADRNAALHMLKVLGEVSGRTSDPERRAVLRAQADRLLSSVEDALSTEADQALFRERYRVIAGLLSNDAAYDAVVAEHDWLGGTA